MDALLQIPGQLSEHVGMADLVLQLEPDLGELLETAARCSGLPLPDLVASGPPAALQSDRAAAVAMIAVSCMMHEALRRRAAVRVLGVAGHSVGFTSALVMAGALELPAAIEVALHVDDAIAGWSRSAAGAYGMGVVVGLSAGAVEPLALAHGVDIACVNAATQIAVSGLRERVEALLEAARAAGALAVHLMPMGKPMHARMLRAVEGELSARLASIPVRDPRLAVVSHVDGSPVATAAEARALLATQVGRRVEWRSAVKALLALAPGGTPLLECGPGDVLSRLARFIDRGARALPLARLESWGALETVHA